MMTVKSFFTFVVIAVVVPQLRGVDASFRLSTATRPWNTYSPGITFKVTAPSSVVGLVKSAMNYMHGKVPGLTFVNDQSTTSPHLLFVYDTWSTTTFCEDSATTIGGDGSETTTTITLYRNLYVDCVTLGWVVHLTMHAFGFLHEHQRPDAVMQIHVNYNNMDPPFTYPPFRDMFLDARSDGTTDGTSYDYMSVMHYNAFALSRDRTSRTKPTILAIPPDVISRRSYGHSTTGSMSYLSHGDITTLRKMFPSSSNPALDSSSCENGGTWYGICACRPGFSGAFCTNYDIDCYHSCQNGGTCMSDPTTTRPKCFNCPAGFTGSYCEQTDESYSLLGQCLECPWFAMCVNGVCSCDPYPYNGPSCQQPTVVQVTTTISTTTVPTTTTITATTTIESSTTAISTTIVNSTNSTTTSSPSTTIISTVTSNDDNGGNSRNYNKPILTNTAPSAIIMAPLFFITAMVALFN